VCGIIGVAVERGALPEKLGDVLYGCLKRLEYRGYDSVGIAFIDDLGRLVVRKSVGKIDEVREKIGFSEIDGVVGLGHTRWATHGRPSDENAHPHTDCSGTIAVVHNGIIENFSELRKWLENLGHRFRSETDTEVIPHLIEEFIRRGMSIYSAFKRAVSLLRGTYAIAAIYAGGRRILFARNTSPLVIGLGKGYNFIASDIPAFLRYTNRVVVVHDGELGYVTSSSVRLEAADGKVVSVETRARVVEWSPEAVEKGGYRHFMEKEILEQPQALAQTIAGLGEEVRRAAELIARAERVIFVAAGSSYHASIIGALALTRLAKVPSVPLVSSEARWWLGRWLSDRDVVIAVSQSGETIDTLIAVRIAKDLGAKVVALSNVLGSAIPRESHLAIYTRAGPEIGVAATKTFTTQVAALSYLAATVAKLRGEASRSEYEAVVEDLRRCPISASLAIESGRSLVSKALDVFVRSRSAFYLGRGFGLGVAKEGALKMKEVAYVHAEAYPAGESKHGPIALVEPGFPTLFCACSSEELEMVASNVEEMKSRGAVTILVAPRKLAERVRSADHVIEVPKHLSPAVQAIPLVIPLQMLAYETAVARGYDPDKPRNLAKTVTVI